MYYYTWEIKTPAFLVDNFGQVTSTGEYNITKGNSNITATNSFAFGIRAAYATSHISIYPPVYEKLGKDILLKFRRVNPTMDMQSAQQQMITNPDAAYERLIVSEDLWFGAYKKLPPHTSTINTDYPQKITDDTYSNVLLVNNTLLIGIPNTLDVDEFVSGFIFLHKQVQLANRITKYDYGIIDIVLLSGADDYLEPHYDSINQLSWKERTKLQW